MTDLTDNVESQIVNWLFNNVSTRAASTEVVVSLHTADPGETPDGTTELDAATTSYARQSTAAGTAWNITEPDTATNANEISFPQATEDWGTVSHFVLWDGAGNALFSDVIRDSSNNPTTKTVSTDDTISFAAGSITATLD